MFSGIKFQTTQPDQHYIIDQFKQAYFKENADELITLFNEPENKISFSAEESLQWLRDTDNNTTKFNDFVKFIERDMNMGTISDINTHEKVESLLKD